MLRPSALVKFGLYVRSFQEQLGPSLFDARVDRSLRNLGKSTWNIGATRKCKATVYGAPMQVIDLDHNKVRPK